MKQSTNATKLTKSLSLISVILFLQLNITAQNVIITDDADYTTTSAMLDVKSETKGMLIPRLSTTNRLAIDPLVAGLIVYDYTLSSLFYCNGSGWLSLFSDIGSLITDPDVPLFSVKNKLGEEVFGVYPEGISMLVGDGDSKGTRGGFVVGGLNSSKGSGTFLDLTPDNYFIGHQSG